MNEYRFEGLSLELKFVGESKEYDLSYWTRLSSIKSMSRKELSILVDKIQDVIQAEYLKDRVSDINETVESIQTNIKQLLYKPNDNSDSTGLDNFLE